MKTDTTWRGAFSRGAKRFAGRILPDFLVGLSLCGSTLWGGFQDATQSVGIDYLHADKASVPTNEDLGLDRTTLTPVSNHAGAAAVDIDGDGWTDFIGGRWQKPPVLYRNRGDGTFIEEGAARGMSVIPDAAAFGAADFDNDGDADIVMTPHLGDRFYFMINDGTGHFVDEAEARGVALSGTTQKHEGYSVGVVDFDLDGYLDIYISEWGPFTSEEDSLHSVLLRNRGAEAPGHFENVTVSAGLLQPKNGVEQHHGFSTGWADFDEDGWPDVALIADFNSGQFYWNNGNGTFVEGSDAAGVGLDEFGMGVAIADYDNDGLLDYFATSIYSQFFIDTFGTNTGNKLYRNLGGRKFEEVSNAAGVNDTGWGWGTAFLDYDNDGDKDLIVTNGDDIGESLPQGHAHRAALDDPTTLFQNDGSGKFSDITTFSGISDTKQGKAIVVLDYDNDGDEDVIITNTFDRPIVYRNDTAANGRDWIRFTFRGETSNRDGIGAIVRVTEAGKTQTLLFNPTNAYIGQREGVLHCGLGETDGVVDVVEVTWPSGIEQRLVDLDANQLYTLEEPEAPLTLPSITTQPSLPDGAPKDSDVTLSVVATGNPAPVYIWEKDGTPIPGANGSTLTLERISPYQEGEYRVRVINTEGEVVSEPVEVIVTIDLAKHSIARWWNEMMLEAVRNDFPDPPIVARNLYHASAAMWDAFWAYEEDGWSRARPVFHKESVASADWGESRLTAQREAISHAVFTVLTERFRKGPRAERAMAGFRWLMEAVDCDPDFVSVEGMSPAAVGNRIGVAVLQINYEDGSNELDDYADLSGYAPVNQPLIYGVSGAELVDPNRWQPISLELSVTKNGIPRGAETQSFLAPGWNRVEPFALLKPSPGKILLDPGPPPLFGADTAANLVEQNVQLIEFAAMLDPSDEAMLDASPGAMHNNRFPTQDGTGRAVNPFTGEPYASNWVKRGDYWRVVAEFWSDGPGIEGPPGVWNMLHNQVTDDPRFERRLMGVGPELSALEWDTHAYLALNGALHDAAIATWTIKAAYDSARPISMIRYLAGLGQSTDPDLPSYHADGLPLRDNLIELVTDESSAPGERHEALAGHVGEVALRAWAGVPDDPRTQTAGVDWILGEDWVPYHLKTFPTPNFAGYISGHSTFSRAAAESLSLLTGSPFFPGGLKEFHFGEGQALQVEYGPSEPMSVQVATYYDASDLTGIARLFCGVHIAADDFVGRKVGARVGVDAFLKALSLRSPTDELEGMAEPQLRLTGSEAGESLFVEFTRDDGLAPALPMRRSPSLEAAQAAEDAGIYFVFEPGDEAPEMHVLAKGRYVTEIRIQGSVGVGEIVELEFELRQTDPVALLARAARAQASGETEGLTLSMRRLDADEVSIDSNERWWEGDRASLAAALASQSSVLPGDSIPGDCPALPMILSPGRYRLTLESNKPRDRVELRLHLARSPQPLLDN